MDEVSLLRLALSPKFHPYSLLWVEVQEAPVKM